MSEGNTATLKPGGVRLIKMSEEILQDAEDKNRTLTEHLAALEAESGDTYSGAESELDAYERQLAARDLDVTDSRRLVQDFLFAGRRKSVFVPRIRPSSGLPGNGARPQDAASGRHRDSARKDHVAPVCDRTTSTWGAKTWTRNQSAQGAEFSAATLKDRDKNVKMEKVGRQFRMTYESVKGISLPFASIFLQRVGFRLSRQVCRPRSESSSLWRR